MVSYLQVNRGNGLCSVSWIEIDLFVFLDNFHGFTRVTNVDAFLLSCHGCEWLNFFVVFSSRGPTERIPGILPCSRQCWRRTEMEARGARRIQVCGTSGGKTASWISGNKYPIPQRFRHRLYFRGRWLWKLYKVSFINRRVITWRLKLVK